MSKYHHRLIRRYRVQPGSRVRLVNHDPADLGGLDLIKSGPGTPKERAAELLQVSQTELAHAQELLWASDTHSVLVVLQGMDAAGKDGTIRHVMSGVSAQGCEVHGYSAPTELELDHTFLWRYWKDVPERGRIGLFNRSYYEEVLVVRVHPEVLAAQRLPSGPRGKRFWNERYEDINAFERHLVRNGTVIMKFFLNLSKEEQRRRLLQRIEVRDKHWKFTAADLEERSYWDDYMGAYEAMLRATSTTWAPWYVIPADHKYNARASVAAILSGTIRQLGLEYPKVTAADERHLRSARRRLLAGD
jgi:PPK2 family polyphosphate:nucleotide phosphotransferase